MAKSISQLDAITDEAIDLSQFLAIDDPAQTFKMSLLQLRDFFTGQLYPVGSTMFRLDNRTPNDCGFPGTWSKIAADLSLHTAAADGSNVNTSTGSNSPTVPVPQHTHTATQPAHTHAATQAAHTHAATQAAHGHTASQTAHTHTVSTASGSTREHCSDGCQEGSLVNMTTGTTSSVAPAISIGTIAPAITVPSVTPVITVPNAQPAITVDNAGTAGATLDVRGARILGHLWHRTA